LDAFSTNQATEKHDLLSQEFATPKQALETNQEFKVVCEREVRFWVSRVRLYLDDERMVAALFTPLQHQIIEEYAMFRGLLGGRYGPELLQEAYTEHGLLSSLRQWDKVV
jgi:conserved oligomeric Golgi complex subunit 3